MTSATWAVALSLALFLAMLVCLEAGYRIARRNSQASPETAHEGVGAIEAAVFALFGLLLGFSFAGGTTRLDARRELIVKEANAIGTAYLRVDLLAAGEQPAMRQLFRQYLDARLRIYRAFPSLDAADHEIEAGNRIQQQIWDAAIRVSRSDPTQNIARLLLPALNDMIDVTTERSVAMHTRLPGLIFWLLITVALLSGLLGGYALEKRKRRSITHAVLFAAVTAITVYAILDLDSPRSGLIRLDAADKAMFSLRDSIH